jgi:crotonobetainyl-CoA:carnitine CoA-transferase CaiB-like acyl-CoA transferase
VSAVEKPSNSGFALQGIRVLDFTWIHAGPSATRILADQGAEVIKVESNNALAVVGGPSSATARGLGQRHNWNAGKRSISLDMKTPQGVAIAKRLVAVSDVVAENFSGRVMTGWGMDYESIRRVKPDLVMLSMSGFGRTGPWKDRVSYGQTLQAWSGFTELTGFPNTDPCGPASAYSDAVGGMAGAQAVLLALIHRAHTGQGQWIDLSQFEALSSLLDTLVLDLSANGADSHNQRTGNRPPHASGAPHGAYRCQGDDRWVAISVPSENEWESLIGAMGHPPWAQDERFATASGRSHHSEELDALLETWTLQHSAEAVMHLLQDAGVPAGVVQTGADLAENDPHLKERGFFRQVLDGQGVSRTIEGAAYILSRTPGGPSRGAPEFGADQTYVLREILGMSDEELADCAIAGVFE